MGKKLKKKHPHKYKGEQKDKPREILTSNTDVPSCTDVPINNSPPKRIKVISHSSPMRFNRSFFQLSSEHMREQGFGYYLATKILQPVKNIQDQPNYKELYRKLQLGFFTPPKKTSEPVYVSKVDPVLCLKAHEMFNSTAHITGNPCVPDQEPYDLLVRDMEYKICNPFKDITGSWKVLYYLYRVYELQGFGDLAIDGQPYRVRFHPNSEWKEDLALVQQDDKLIIGRLIA